MAVGQLQIDVLPASWEQGPEPGWFRATAVPAKRAVWSRVRAFQSLDRNPDYLLDRVGTRREGPLGRPEVVSLPEPLDDGIAVLAFELEPDDTLTARIDLVRRAWDLDILVSARTPEIGATEALVSAMVELLERSYLQEKPYEQRVFDRPDPGLGDLVAAPPRPRHPGTAAR